MPPLASPLLLPPISCLRPTTTLTPSASFTNAVESRTDVTVDLVYFTLGHLRRPGQVQVPRGTKDTR